MHRLGAGALLALLALLAGDPAHAVTEGIVQDGLAAGPVTQAAQDVAGAAAPLDEVTQAIVPALEPVLDDVVAPFLEITGAPPEGSGEPADVSPPPAVANPEGGFQRALVSPSVVDFGGRAGALAAPLFPSAPRRAPAVLPATVPAPIFTTAAPAAATGRVTPTHPSVIDPSDESDTLGVVDFLAAALLVLVIAGQQFRWGMIRPAEVRRRS